MSVTAEMVHEYEEMRRSTVQYDYERVFWGSAYGIGLVILGWVTLKIGRIVQSVQDPIGGLGRKLNNKVIDWVEGNNRDTPVPKGFPNPEWLMISHFRDNPQDYLDWKAALEESREARPPEFKALDLFDTFYGRYGAVLPAGVLGFQMLSEAIRVRRLRDG